MNIRRATVSDAPAILGCLAAAFAPYRQEYTGGAYQATILTPETVGRRLREMTVLLAVADTGEIAGTVAYAAIESGEGHLRGMAVDPAREGTGTASALLGAALAELRAARCARVTLETTAPLRRAIAFYRFHGFRPTGRVTDFHGMPLHQYARSITVSLATPTPVSPPHRSS